VKRFLRFAVILTIISIIIVTLYFFSGERREKIMLEKYGNAVTKYGYQFNVDGNLIFAVMKAESNFDETAVSDKGAVGLMQILPSTGEFISRKLNEEFDRNLLFDYETNIKYGAWYLSYLKGKFDDFICVLAAYNAGEGNVAYWLTKYSDDGIHLNSIPYKETENYVNKVKSYYNNYKKNYNY
jgi:soluble lytic murein transglycosylase